MAEQLNNFHRAIGYFHHKPTPVLTKQIMILVLNFTVFPTALWVMSAVFSLPLLPSVILGFSLSALATFFQRRGRIGLLKSLVIVMLGIYAVLLFTKIGVNILDAEQIIISVQALFLSSLLIFTAFIYYILLTQFETKQTPSLDWQLNRVLLHPSILLCLLVASILTILELLLLMQLAYTLEWLAPKLLDRGVIPPLTLLLFNWGLLLLFGKWLILLKESSYAKDSLLLNIYAQHPSEFWDKVWVKSESFYTFPSYINYAMPVLGFIGTVLGISLSADGIAKIISSPDGISSSNQNLGDAIAPLGIAFDTTLVALSLGLILTLIYVLLQAMESRVLNQLKDLSNAQNH